MRVIRDPCGRSQYGDTFNTEFEEHIEIKETIVENDHDKLVNRDAADQHPTSAITGLDNTIEGLNTGVSGNSQKITELKSSVSTLNSQMTSTLSAEDALTNSEIEQLLGGL